MKERSGIKKNDEEERIKLKLLHVNCNVTIYYTGLRAGCC